MSALRSLAHAWGHAEDATPRQARVIAVVLLVGSVAVCVRW